MVVAPHVRVWTILRDAFGPSRDWPPSIARAIEEVTIDPTDKYKWERDDEDRPIYPFITSSSPLVMSDLPSRKDAYIHETLFAAALALLEKTLFKLHPANRDLHPALARWARFRQTQGQDVYETINHGVACIKDSRKTLSDICVMNKWSLFPPPDDDEDDKKKEPQKELPTHLPPQKFVE